MPSRCRSSINSRSNWAIAPEHVEHQTAGAIGRVDGLLKHPKSDGLRFQPATNGNEVGHAPCKPVELCDNENVAFPCIVERGLELRPLGYGRHLFRENFSELAALSDLI
jgi:hypothetical protein